MRNEKMKVMAVRDAKAIIRDVLSEHEQVDFALEILWANKDPEGLIEVGDRIAGHGWEMRRQRS